MRFRTPEEMDAALLLIEGWLDVFKDLGGDPNAHDVIKCIDYVLHVLPWDLPMAVREFNEFVEVQRVLCDI